MEDYTDEEEMDDVNLDDERERHCGVVSEYNDGGGAMKRHCYVLRGGMSILMKIKSWLRVLFGGGCQS